MQGFQDTKIRWRDDEYTIPAKGILPLIAEIESILVGDSSEQAITVLLRPAGPKHAVLAQAFGAALRFAGCDVTDEEVYFSIQQSIVDQSDVLLATNASVIALLSIMSPPLASQVASDGDSEKKTKAAKD